MQHVGKIRFLATILFMLSTSGLKALPVAYFSSNSPVCDGSPVCFTDLSYVGTPPFGYITTWAWNFGDGSPVLTIQFPYNPSVCHNFPNGGIYMVTLTVTDTYGNMNSWSSNVTIRPGPVPNFMVFGECLYQATDFYDFSYTAGGGVIITWLWNFGDGVSSSLQNPVHFFSSAGDHNVKLRITNSYGCADSIVKVVPIKVSVGGSVSGNATIILGQNTGSMSLSGNTGSVVNWQRSCNGGSYVNIPGTAGLSGYSEAPADTGTWNYRAVVQTGSCPSAYSAAATVIVELPGILRTWNGNAGDSWVDPANWEPMGIPALRDDILVPCCTPSMPQIKENGYGCNNLTIESDATMTVAPGIKFTVNGTMEVK